MDKRKENYKENKEAPEYSSLAELIETMKQIIHREYFSGIREQVIMDSIELWMREAARVVLVKEREKPIGAVDETKIGHTCI